MTVAVRAVDEQGADLADERTPVGDPVEHDAVELDPHDAVHQHRDVPRLVTLVEEMFVRFETTLGHARR